MLQCLTPDRERIRDGLPPFGGIDDIHDFTVLDQVDHVRAAMAEKRGGGDAAAMLTLSAADDEAAPTGGPQALIALEKALAQLQLLDAGLHELLEMITFAGTSTSEVAQLRGVSRRTVERDLAKARALLSELLGDNAPLLG